MKLKNFSLRNVSDILSDSELKRVVAGYGYNGGCLPFTSGTCGWKGPDGCMCGVSRDTALSYFYSYGGNWCCDSCGSSTYCR